MKTHRTTVYARILTSMIMALLFSVSLSAQEVISRKEGESLADIGKRILPEKTEFAHPPVQLSFGPFSSEIVVLFREASGVNENFTGWVLVPRRSDPHSYVKYGLPAMFEAPNTFTIDVKAVFGAQVAGESERDLVVLYEYHHNGRPQDSGYASYVYHWSGTSFQLRDKLWESLAGLKTAAAVRHKLRAVHD